MRTFVFLTFILGISFKAHSSVKIIDIFKSSKIDNVEAVLMMSSGEVLYISQGNPELLKQAIDAKKKQQTIEVDKISNDQNSPNLVSAINITSHSEQSTATREKEMFNYNLYRGLRFNTMDPIENSNMTTLRDYNEAQSIMDNMNRETRDESQCYNRAHMWTYEALANNNVNLGKVWIFFTRRYIEEFSYKWWFHVAPTANVSDGLGMYILDKGFTSIPYNLENWKNLFMKNNASCPVIKNYLNYENSQSSEYCYLMTSSQYYWQPYQLKNLAVSGSRTWGYRTSNLKTAYADALISWDKTIPKLSGSVEDLGNSPTPEVPEESTDNAAEVEIRNAERAERYRLEEIERENRERERLEREKFYPALNIVMNKGYSVIDENYRTGKVTGLLGRDEVLVEYDESRYGERVQKIATLGVEVRSFYTFKDGTEVITENNRTGRLKEVYSNGIARVDYDQFSEGYTVLTKKTGYAVSKVDSFYKGLKVMLISSGSEGKVKYVYSNKKALIDIDNRRGHVIKDISELTFEVRGLDNLRKGSRILFNSATGKIKKLFSSGQVQIKLDRSRHPERVVESSQISYEVSSISGFSKGHKILYRNRFVGKIEYVFSNNKAIVDIKGERGSKLVDLSDLRLIR